MLSHVSAELRQSECLLVVDSFVPRPARAEICRYRDLVVPARWSPVEILPWSPARAVSRPRRDPLTPSPVRYDIHLQRFLIVLSPARADPLALLCQRSKSLSLRRYALTLSSDTRASTCALRDLLAP